MSKQTTQYETLSGWAAVVESMWVDKIISLDVIDTHTLMQSFVNHVQKQANGNVDKIQHMFTQYGIYQDMGVGKETAVGNSGDLGKEKVRKEKPWYSSVFFREVKKLRDYMLYRYGTKVASLVANTLDENFDQRYSSNINANTVSNMKTVRYREKTRERTMRNYYSDRVIGDRFYGKDWKAFDNDRVQP